MFLSTAKFAEREAEKSGYYDIYRVLEDGTEENLEISIQAESIEGEKYGAIFARKEDGTYSIYACPWASKNGEQKFGRLRFFIGGILEFQIEDSFLVYKTEEGWFFLVLTRAFWNIHNDDIMKKRRSMIPKFMEESEDVLNLQELKDKSGRAVACIAYAENKSFILFEGERFCTTDVPLHMYDDEGNQHLNCIPLPGEFLKIHNYEPIEGFDYSIKVYPSEKDEFYIGSLLSKSECKQPEVLYTEIVNQWEAERGMYYAVANKLGEQALIHVVDGYSPRMVTGWVKKTIVMLYQLSSRTKFTLVEGDERTVIFDDIK